jgi:hypothetical protein
MCRFTWLGVWGSSLLAVAAISASPLFAAPFLTGSSDYFRTRINWQAFADFAPDNPLPKSGDYTYVYWIESLEDPLRLYSFNLFGPSDLAMFGEVTGTGYLPDTGLAPIESTNDHWTFSLTGADFPAGTRTASLYLHSPDEPGLHSAVPYSCNPLLCDPVSGAAVGPISGPGIDRADYNGDGAFSFDDYEVWKAAFGTTNSPADGNRDGIVDAADYTVWREAYSRYDWGGFDGTNVPEPNSLTLLGIVLFSACMIRSCMQRCKRAI